jgi:hypothetical protein
VATGKVPDKSSEERKAAPPKTGRLDFDFETIVGVAIADVVVRKRPRLRKSNWNSGPKR